MVNALTLENIGKFFCGQGWYLGNGGKWGLKIGGKIVCGLFGGLDLSPSSGAYIPPPYKIISLSICPYITG